jgi:hypothetical protein
MRNGLLAFSPLDLKRSATERVASSSAEFILLLIRWWDETLAEVETWPATNDIGLTPHGRRRLEQLLDQTLQD